MKILVLSNHYPPHHGGGYGLLCQWLSQSLAGRGHEVNVLTSRTNGVATADDPASIVPVHRELRPIVPGDRPAALLRATLINDDAVRRAINDFGPDIVYCHGIDGIGFQAYHTATESGVPSLTAIGDTWLAQAWRDLTLFDPWIALATGGRRRGLRTIVKRGIGHIGRVAGLYTRPTPPRFHPCTAISQFLVHDLARACPESAGQVEVIPPMLPPGYFRPDGEPIGHSGARSPRLRALFVGRMEMLKGPDVAIRGLAAAIARGADATLTFAGLRLHELRPQLELIADSLGVGERITWAGTLPADRLLNLFRRHDVFLFPSRIAEGFGIVNAEAMACGLPVIGSAHTGSADIIVDDVTGFRVAVEDADAIGRCLARLHRNRDLLERFSREATRMALRHHPDRILNRTESILYRTVQCGRAAERAAPLLVGDPAVRPPALAPLHS